MKRVKLTVGYAIVIGFFASLLTLELCFIAMTVAAVAAIVALVHDDLGIFWMALFFALFGLWACLSAVLAVLFPYYCVSGWMSTATAHHP